MTNKFYLIKLDKNIDKSDKEAKENLKFMESKFRVFNSKNLYVQLFSGTIACQDAFYADLRYHMPIIVREDEEGCFDKITGKQIDIIYPIVKLRELTPEEVYIRQHGLETDNMGFIRYNDAIKEYIEIMNSYKNFLRMGENLTIKESFERKRNKN